MRGVKVKALRKLYLRFLEDVMPRIPKGRRPISFRVFRRRATNA